MDGFLRLTEFDTGEPTMIRADLVAAIRPLPADNDLELMARTRIDYLIDPTNQKSYGTVLVREAAKEVETQLTGILEAVRAAMEAAKLRKFEDEWAAKPTEEKEAFWKAWHAMNQPKGAE